MAHIGLYYELAFRRDMRMQQGSNKVAFPKRYVFHCTGFVGACAAAFNDHDRVAMDGEFSDADRMMHWTTGPIPTIAGDCTVRLYTGIGTTTMQNEFGWSAELAGTGIIYRENPVRPNTGFPEVFFGHVPLFQTPGLWSVTGFASSRCIPEYW